MIDRLNGRTSVLIASAGLLLVLLVGWLGFVSPQRAKVDALETEIADKQVQLEVTQALVNGPVLRRSTAELATLRTAIPDEVRMSQILRQLAAAATDSRVRVLGVTPEPTTTVGAADLVAMNVNLEGYYNGIQKFLRILRSQAEIEENRDVRASGRLFAIDSIQFTGAGASGSSLIQAVLAINAFAFSQPVAVPTTTPDVTGAETTGAAVETGGEAASR
jgi:Tfp pilus assembly protein PilO